MYTPPRIRALPFTYTYGRRVSEVVERVGEKKRFGRRNGEE